MAGTRRYDRHGQVRVPNESEALILGVSIGFFLGVIIGAWLA
jgi:hypothetical protein